MKMRTGGERKRLAIACELLSEPSLLYLDEPTSGLDAFQAQKVVEALRVLTEEGALRSSVALPIWNWHPRIRPLLIGCTAAGCERERSLGATAPADGCCCAAATCFQLLLEKSRCQRVLTMADP